MTHDPLCPMWSKVVAGDVCDCDLIAKVREDMLDKCVLVVSEAMNNRIHDFASCDKEDDCASFVYPAFIVVDDVLSALTSLKENS